MAQFNLTNHWIEFRYTVEGMQHVAKYQVESTTTVPTVNPAAVELATTGGVASIGLDEFAVDWTLALSPLFATPESTFDSFTLYYQPDGALEPTFIAAATPDVTWTQPTSTAGPVLGSQVTYTFRAEDGKILKVVLLETIVPPHQRDPQSALGDAANLGLRSEVLGSSNAIQSRSGAWPLLAMNRTVVFNDKIVRKRFSVD